MERLRQYVRYNLWANTRIIDYLNGIKSEDFKKDMGNSFPSIRDTVLHVYGAEKIWLGRLKGNPATPFPTFELLPSKEECLALWKESSAEFDRFISSCKEDFAPELISYNRAEGMERTEAWWIAQHCINHSTFHRGQMITILRQLGYKNIPMTDFIKYGR